MKNRTSNEVRVHLNDHYQKLLIKYEKYTVQEYYIDRLNIEIGSVEEIFNDFNDYMVFYNFLKYFNKLVPMFKLFSFINILNKNKFIK